MNPSLQKFFGGVHLSFATASAVRFDAERAREAAVRSA
jgi:hypothetical protein